ncbi:hypothetical protein ACS0TY_034110 [Phlomoides rotata]
MWRLARISAHFMPISGSIDQKDNSRHRIVVIRCCCHRFLYILSILTKETTTIFSLSYFHRFNGEGEDDQQNHPKGIYVQALSLLSLLRSSTTFVSPSIE